MPLHMLQHYTICPVDLEKTKDFYVKALGLDIGYRPPLNFPGYWLYGGSEAAILHIAATLPDTADRMSPGKPTGQMDHISLKASDAVSARNRLKKAGVPFDERPVPGWRLNQIFFTDPAGLKVELTFDMEREDHLLKGEPDKSKKAK